MKTRLLVPTIAVLLSAATRAAAHGTGTLQPHAHPHVEEGFVGLGAWLLAAAAIGAVGLIARALARHR